LFGFCGAFFVGFMFNYLMRLELFKFLNTEPRHFVCQENSDYVLISATMRQMAAEERL
jgi:hypothetical protein